MKTRRIFLLRSIFAFSVTAIFLIGCKKNDTALNPADELVTTSTASVETGSLTTSAAMRNQQNIIFETSFEGSNPFSGMSTDQANTSTSIQASTKYAKEGSQSFRAEVKKDDPQKSSGYRAELTGFPADQGERWYGWSMYFEAPASNGNWTGGYGGHVVQWHPDNSSGSASLALWGSDGVWDVCVNPTGSGSVSHQSKTAAGGSLEKIQVGKWYDIVMHVKWSAGTDGIIEMWKNGVLYFKQTGKATTTTGVYFKFGMNRWSMTNDWVVYYDNLRIGNASATYDDVAPAGSSTTTPANQSPVVNAGSAQSITLPVSSVTLSGAATDADGTITSYQWTKVSGPSAGTITTATSASTTVTGLTAGAYVFNLKATDNGGATGNKDVTVTVNSVTVPTNQIPVVNAGAAQTITLPVSSVILSGTATDADGTIATYLWTKTSGTGAVIVSPATGTTAVTGLTAGAYVFNLKVTDNTGATANSNVNITVNNGTTGIRSNLILDAGFEGTNPFTGFTQLSTGTTYSITGSSTLAREGAKSFRAEVRSSDPSSNGEFRAGILPSVSSGNEVWYGYSTYFENWAANGGGENVIEWQPSGSAASSTLSLWTGDGKFTIVRNPSAQSGKNAYQSGTLKTITPNKWYDFVWHIKWSGGSDGLIELWIDGTLYYRYKGATSTTGIPEFRYGINKWAFTTSGRVLYYDNLRIGNASATYNDVKH
jgi:hypothetical protein